mgnify:CR=1 FL=1
MQTKITGRVWKYGHDVNTDVIFPGKYTYSISDPGKMAQHALEDFGRGEVDVLVGTQMIAKGLDFPNVALVGVIGADLTTAMSDFRASERLFQLVTQVAGRAGRAAATGRVVVQTNAPDTPALRFAVHDGVGFPEGDACDRRRRDRLRWFGRHR